VTSERTGVEVTYKGDAATVDDRYIAAKPRSLKKPIVIMVCREEP
jgi:hypothetical protein